MKTMNSFNANKIASVVSRCFLIMMLVATFASFTSGKASANSGTVVRSEGAGSQLMFGGKDGQETHG